MPLTFDENGALLINDLSGKTFIGLTDTPLAYAGNANKLLFVNAVPDAVAFASAAYWDEVNDRMGINTNAPSAVLHVIQAGTGLAFRVDDNGSDPTFFCITDTGRVGISGDSTPSGSLDVSNGNFIVSTSGNVGVQVVSPSRRIHAMEDSASTGVIIPVARLESQVSGGAGAAGHGPSLEFTGESSTTENQSMAEVAARWSVATHASRRARAEIRAAYIGTDVLVGVLEAPANASLDGNARGVGAVEFQGWRTFATQVSSGDYSVISGGRRHTASGDYSVVAGGDDCDASGDYAAVGGGTLNNSNNPYATIGGGYLNVVAADYGTISGGREHTVSGEGGAIGGGYDNTVSGDYGTVPGGYQATADKYGQVASAAGAFSSSGDAQRSGFVARIDRATHVLNTWYSLYLDGSSAQMVLQPSTAWTFRAMVVGMTANAAQQWSYEIVGLIERDNAGNTTLAASTTTTIFESDANYAAQAVADNVNEALEIQVRRTGGIDYSVQWVAAIYTAECTH